MSEADFEERLRAEKLAAVAEFAAGAGHEINNPAATIIGRARQLLADETDPARRHTLATIIAQGYRIRDMIGDAMTFARPPEPRPTAFDLADAVHTVAAEWRPRFDETDATLDTAAPDATPVFADREQVTVVVAELLKNALHAAGQGGRTTVAVDAASRRLSVTDTGPGFTDEQRRHAFDPFYSGRDAGRGLGFGLSKCWRIVTNAGGTITLGDATPTTIAVTLPPPP
ncbi:MAG: HAMP domain-containing sensor histidine kinase [Planctomycetota bacterium]